MSITLFMLENGAFTVGKKQLLGIGSGLTV